METAHTNRPADSAPVSHAMMTRPFHIRRVTKETYDTFSVELVPRTKDDGFSFIPGQFNMVYTYGIGEVPISISGNPSKPRTLVHTIRAVGAVTRALKSLKVGDAVGVRGPFGNGWPVRDAIGHDVIIVAGGIGLAPLRPAIHHLLANRGEYGRIILLYGARTPEDILYARDLGTWRARFDVETLVTVDRATQSWMGNVGVVTTLIGRSQFDPGRCFSLVCGPEIMMRFALMDLLKKDVAANRIFVSMERNMKCGIGLCGHCQLGPTFVCKDGPVYCYDSIKQLFHKREM